MVSESKITFSKRELIDILISVIVLGFIFSFRKWGSIESGLANFAWATVVVGFAFIIHEMGHKILAEMYDCYAEFKLFPSFLMISLLITFLTQGYFIIAATGAVVISTAYFTRLGYKYVNITLEEKGKIALAGAVSNIFLAFVFKIFGFALPTNLLTEIIRINAIIAFFNLLPIPPLDGSKVIAWSRVIWILGMVSSLIIAFLLPEMQLIWVILVLIPTIAGLFLLAQKFGLK